jgi:hypothetical protein
MRRATGFWKLLHLGSEFPRNKIADRRSRVHLPVSSPQSLRATRSRALSSIAAPALAGLLIACLRSPNVTPDWAIAEPDVDIDPVLQLPFHVTDRESGIRLVLIRPGVIKTNATSSSPARQVSVSHPFYIGVFEVTESEWYAVMGAGFVGTRRGGLYPIAGVSIEDVSQFLSRTGLRLPTSEEWEFACRAGSPGLTYANVDAVAWHRLNSGPHKFGYEGQRAHPVGTKRPNAFGLYDTLGNVWEICAQRKTRGGSYYNSPSYASAGFEGAIASGVRDETYGFRVARDP